MLNSIVGSEITLDAFLICTVISLVLGIGLAFVAMYREKSSQSLALTLAILPAAVQIVIMLVNGNIGAGVAVAGAFGLVRFRSQPGTAREIAVIFLAMAVGLATGMGFVVLAVLTFVLLGGMLMLLTLLHFGQKPEAERTLRITIPENLDYDGLFDNILDNYTRQYELVRVKTANMGTMFELEYRITLPDGNIPKQFLDELRRREAYHPTLLAFADLTLDPGTGVLTCSGQDQRLSGREFQIMELFMRNPQQVFSAERIMEKVWGWDNNAEINVVWVNISNLRKKLKAVGSRATLTANRGLGYLLEDHP